jgi:hypothetical protein
MWNQGKRVGAFNKSLTVCIFLAMAAIAAGAQTFYGMVLGSRRSPAPGHQPLAYVENSRR